MTWLTIYLTMEIYGGDATVASLHVRLMMWTSNINIFCSFTSQLVLFIMSRTTFKQAVLQRNKNNSVSGNSIYCNRKKYLRFFWKLTCINCQLFSFYVVFLFEDLKMMSQFAFSDFCPASGLIVHKYMTLLLNL